MSSGIDWSVTGTTRTPVQIVAVNRLTGEVTVRMPDGATQKMRAGDTLVVRAQFSYNED